MTRSLTSTPRLAGLAALALSAATLAMPMTSVAPAIAAQDEPSSLQAANDKAAQWIAKHEGKVKLAKEDRLVRAGTFQGGNGTVAVAYERLHQGLPVIGGDFVVVTGADGAVLNTLGTVDHHQHRIHGGQGAIGIFGEVFVTGGIQQVDHAFLIRELHH